MSVILATGGYDHKIRFWDAPSGACVRVIPFPDSPINKLEITSGKQCIAAAGNPNIEIFDVDSQNPQPVLTLKGHKDAVTSIGFQMDARYLYSGSEDGTIKLWDLRGSSYSRSMDCKGPVRSVTLREDRDEIISGDSNGMVKIWDLGRDAAENGSIVAMQPGDSGTLTSAIQAVDISADSKTLVAANNHGMVFAWDPNTPVTVMDESPIVSPDAPVDGDASKRRQDQLDVDLDNKSAAANVDGNDDNGYGDDGDVGDNNTGNRSTKDVNDDADDEGESDNVNHDSADHEQEDRDQTLPQHDAATPSSTATSNSPQLKLLTQFRAHPIGTYCLHARLAPSRDILCTTSSDGSAKLWNTSTWMLEHDLKRHSKWVWDAAFCEDSSYLVTASSDKTAKLWNLGTAGDVVRQYHGHESTVTCVALNDNSN